MQRLAGKTAIITGGGRGIGYAVAQSFYESGAQVILWDIDSRIGQEAVAKLQTDGPAVRFKKVNVADSEAVRVATESVLQEFGKIDILINNAGITRDARLVKMTSEEWQEVLDVNLSGVYNCTRTIAPHMIEQNQGRVVNASSIVGLYGNFGQTNYVATKSAVIGMTKVWARELGRHNITVNAIAPGFIATEMIKTVPQKIIDTMLEKTPLNRLGTPQEVASAYLFLASEEAAFINGAVLSVDGGMTI